MVKNIPGDLWKICLRERGKSEGRETDGYLMWKAYGKSLFRKRNSIEVKEYFIQREKKRYMYIRHVVSGGKYK